MNKTEEKVLVLDIDGTLTNSEKGKEILDHFSEYLPKFKKVIPYDYNRMQMAIVQMEEKGLNAEQAQIEAFYVSVGKA